MEREREREREREGESWRNGFPVLFGWNLGIGKLMVEEDKDVLFLGGVFGGV